MSGIFKAFKTSAQAEQNGVPVEFVDAINDDGTIPTIYVRHNGSKYTTTYQSALEAAYKPFKRRVEANEPAAKTAWTEKVNDLFCDYMITSWENILDENNQPIEFTQDNVRLVMRALPELLGRVVAASIDFDRFRESELKEAAKN